MKHLCLVFWAILLFSINLKASTDTTYQYLSQFNKPSLPEFSYYVVKTFQMDNGRWRRIKLKEEKLDTVNIVMSAKKDFKNIDTTVYVGDAFDHYSINLEKGFTKIAFLRKDGRLAGYCLKNDKNEILEQKGWDLFGKEIPDYICQQEASFVGGASNWKQYLIENLNQEVPRKNNAPRNTTYTVVVQFIVDKEGFVKQVQAQNNPGYGTAEEAVRVVAASPKWLPAVQNNKAVIYRQRQQISFRVD